jgi:hypothetical protein
MCTRDVVRALSLVWSAAIQRASDQHAQGLTVTLFAETAALPWSLYVCCVNSSVK